MAGLHWLQAALVWRWVPMPLYLINGYMHACTHAYINTCIHWVSEWIESTHLYTQHINTCIYIYIDIDHLPLRRIGWDRIAKVGRDQKRYTTADTVQRRQGDIFFLGSKWLLHEYSNTRRYVFGAKYLLRIPALRRCCPIALPGLCLFHSLIAIVSLVGIICLGCCHCQFCLSLCVFVCFLLQSKHILYIHKSS